MAKINRNDAAERIAEMLNGCTQMTETEYNSFIEELKANTVKDLAKCFRAGIVTNPDGTRYACIATMHRLYARVEIIEEESNFEEAVESAKAAAEEVIKMNEEEPKFIFSVSHYTNNKGKTYDAHNMISKSRAEQMVSKGYTYELVNTGELAQEAYDRLIKKFDVVRIYSQTTRVKGFHTFYAMCK